MTKPIARDPMYRKRAFDADIIELCVRWYITYRLSYRDLVEMMAERGVNVAHSTILRWVTRYVPEFEKRWNRYSKAVGTSWRVDETYISIKAKWHYLYRAVDKHGKTVDFLLRRDRGIAAAQAFFRKALASTLPRVPRKVTLDGHVPSRRALWLLAQSGMGDGTRIREREARNTKDISTTEISRVAPEPLCRMRQGISRDSVAGDRI
jgi:transposase-like protein